MKVFTEMLENIWRIETLSPFLAEVDQPESLDIDRFEEILVTVPEPHRPHAPMVRLLDIVDAADHMRAFSPFITNLLSMRYLRPSEITGDYEFIVSKKSFNKCQKQVSDEWSDEIKKEQSTHITIRIYDGEFPYGLFICEETVVLAAYNDLGRMQALVEAEGELTVKWGEQVYETYRSQSQRPRETDISCLTHTAEMID